ncbi:solute carrier family 12 member 4-like isoform X1 [Vespula maculifrons]|uniref:Uncharacterized protein n=3 Tax=Vespula TaxID=7451 RepID=A0A834NYY2_VESPE|nr:hypothetical protein HZH66_007942 [Vespula vulgaris]KAF7421705.1 hypothetical protein H0235_009541 [Vespula pensylvanica]
MERFRVTPANNTAQYTQPLQRSSIHEHGALTQHTSTPDFLMCLAHVAKDGSIIPSSKAKSTGILPT